jgi:hypothetical protein
VSRLEERIKGELRELLPPTICFFVAFRTITMSRAPMFREYGVKCSPPPPAQPSELRWSRRWWIADQLPTVNRFPDKPPSTVSSPLLSSVNMARVVYRAVFPRLHDIS